MRLACGAGLQTGKLWRAAARERHNQRACKAAPAAGHGTQSGACGAPASTALAARSERAERRLGGPCCGVQSGAACGGLLCMQSGACGGLARGGLASRRARNATPAPGHSTQSGACGAWAGGLASSRRRRAAPAAGNGYSLQSGARGGL